MRKSRFFIVATLFFLLGIGATYKSGRIVCLPGLGLDVFNFQCILTTESPLLALQEGRGIRLDLGTVIVIKQLPFLLYGIGGAFLIAGLVKSMKSNN